MADINIHVTDNSNEFMDQFYDAVDVALEEIGLFVESEAKKLLNRPYTHSTAPSPRPYIDTGLLRNSITHAVSGKSSAISSYQGDKSSRYNNSGKIPRGSYHGHAPNDPKEKRAVYVGTNVEYAVYVHEGTENIKTPNRYLKDAVTLNEDQIKKRIEVVLNRET